MGCGPLAYGLYAYSLSAIGLAQAQVQIAIQIHVHVYFFLFSIFLCWRGPASQPPLPPSALGRGGDPPPPRPPAPERLKHI